MVLRDVKKMRVLVQQQPWRALLWRMADKITAEMLDRLHWKGYYGGGMAIGQPISESM